MHINNCYFNPSIIIYVLNQQTLIIINSIVGGPLQVFVFKRDPRSKMLVTTFKINLYWFFPVSQIQNKSDGYILGKIICTQMVIFILCIQKKHDPLGEQ